MPRKRSRGDGDPGGLKCPICKKKVTVIDTRTLDGIIKAPTYYRTRQCLSGHRTLWKDSYIGETRMRNAIFAARQMQEEAQAAGLIKPARPSPVFRGTQAWLNKKT